MKRKASAGSWKKNRANALWAARQLAAGKSNVQFITYSTINRYLGKPGKLGRFFFILAAPQSKPAILLQ
jgi:hypothetical protein